MVRDDIRPVLIGATGLIGEAVLQQADFPLYYLARRTAQNSGRHRALINPPEKWAEEISALRPMVILSSLGTTLKQAGSKQAFRAVDHDLVISCAKAAQRAGAQHFIGVSSVGASAQSKNFYLQTKGEVEQEILGMGFSRVDFLRPGLLQGKRQGPTRFGEGFASKVAPLSDALMIGRLRKYRSISGQSVAAAMLALTNNTAPGHFVHHHDQIARLAD